MSANVADEPPSIYGQINTSQAPSNPASGDQPFEYVTLTGNVIRSVQAPGKGAAPGYKVNHILQLEPLRSRAVSEGRKKGK